jgi:hypothetical protein
MKCEDDVVGGRSRECDGETGEVRWEGDIAKEIKVLQCSKNQQ